MRLTVVGKNIMLTDALKDIVEKKLGKLDRYFDPQVEVNATLSVQKNRQIIEVTIPFNGMILRGEEATEDMYSSIDSVVDKIEKQIIKHKTKLERKIHEGTLRFPEVEEDNIDEEPKIVKNKKFYVKPMDAQEAILQMELLGHNFFVFRDAETNDVNVIYKRKDGNYGLIEPDFQ
ncbi:hypothetical protein Q428_00770 [Fervidicella metallireducens AeB]|uniref:Ribosome hibernation promoting factor n=1 Tax=Fervidicella metallireducens AeB TaxID=1403537 RepID=A0A017S0Y3_9CLOT|nr:ribosome-associated translation inhibitor RaiA [Fervidicella metallireducens]EYE89840.1 hypothetical protein Q428_00770 [Fervidicella metallireducens AeB]